MSIKLEKFPARSQIRLRMALEYIVVHGVKTNGAKCRRQRQHRTIGASELLLAELLDICGRLQIEGKFLDTKVLQAVIDLKDVIDIEVAGIMC